MSCQIFVFSRDRIRGGILKRTLQDNKIQLLLVQKIIDVKDTLSTHDPRVVILDMHSCFKKEAAFLINLVYAVKNCAVILLGDSTTLLNFSTDPLFKPFFFPDPFDPEIIAAKSREILALNIHDAGNRKEDAENLENDLKQYLKLE